MKQKIANIRSGVGDALILADPGSLVCSPLYDVHDTLAQAEHYLCQLSLLSGQQSLEREEIAVEAAIQQALAESADLERDDTVLNTSFSSESLVVSVDQKQFSTMIRNVLKNSSQSMASGGVIQVATDMSYEELPERFNTNASPGWFVTVKISDMGCGFREEVLSQALEPLYSSWSSGSHHGLGLSAVHGIMQSHGGWVRVENAKSGVGATVTLFFPRVLPPVRDWDEPLEQREGNLLIIDDEPAIVDSMSKSLQLFGHKTHAFVEAKDAMSWYEKHVNEVDIVFLDMCMPHMSGAECFAQIKQMNPAQRVAIMSGYASDDRVRGLLSSGAREFFEKPFDLNRIVAWIEAELERSPKIMAQRVLQSLGEGGK